jgi:formylmethanofuran dehydrogenase subunit B
MTVLHGRAGAPVDAALGQAAGILSKARFPLITGTGTDVAGARAAFRLAARLGAAVDFCRNPAVHNYYATMSDKGLMFTSPREARVRADVLLMVGPAAGRSDAIPPILAGAPVLSAGENARREVVWLCSGGAGNALSSDDVMKVGGDVAALPGILAVLNACLRGHPVPAAGYGGLSRANYEEIAGRLLTARFGVIAWSPADFDTMAIEALIDAVQYLNKTTRCTTLPLVGQAGAQTVALVSTWTTGFPPRTGFARGYPEYDPWRFDAARMVAAGECDAIVWISSFDAAVPTWNIRIPTIAITAPGPVFVTPPNVLILTAVPGVDSDAELFDDTIQALVHQPATKRMDDAPTTAAVIDGIINHLEAVAA